MITCAPWWARRRAQVRALRSLSRKEAPRPAAPRVALWAPSGSARIGSVAPALAQRMALAGLPLHAVEDGWQVGEPLDESLERTARWLSANLLGGRWRGELLAVADDDGTDGRAPEGSWDDLVARFLAFLQDEERSPHTIRNYKDDLASFAAWHRSRSGDGPEPGSLAKRDLVDWRQSVEATGGRPDADRVAHPRSHTSIAGHGVHHAALADRDGDRTSVGEPEPDRRRPVHGRRLSVDVRQGVLPRRP